MGYDCLSFDTHIANKAITVVQPVRALPYAVSICYCCSAQRGQQRIADLLASKRSSALRCNTEEKSKSERRNGGGIQITAAQRYLSFLSFKVWVYAISGDSDKRSTETL